MSAGVTFRLVRATAFAVVCSGLGASAHLLGGGTVTGPLAATALAISLTAAVPTTGRERGTHVVLFLLAGVQVVLHLLFSLAPSLSGAPGGHAHSGLVPGVGMLVAHGLATVLTALWLSRGEAVLWGLLRRLGARVLVLLRVAHRTPYWPVIAGTVEPVSLRSALLEHSLSGRAPPTA
ncbi:MFS transporter [Nonomuraea sp. NPDC004580]|uniref:MFS transporter n=1 Tax=Nonomuraea sp. NPDC004580 TaxID=3154552 RepID=UPI0033BA89B0